MSNAIDPQLDMDLVSEGQGRSLGLYLTCSQ